MAVEVFSDDPFPSLPGPTRDSDLNAPSSFHNEAFPLAQTTSPASSLRRLPATKSKGPVHRVEKRPSRSVSTPPLRAFTMSDSEQDKKRNKLGYQRISIACSHCRRRKIRCLLADKDPQGRCQNCIRLKKECVFYPIDQQGTYESQSDPNSRRGVGSASSSGVSSTSPDIPTPQSHAIRRSHFSPLPQQPLGGYQGVAFEPGAAFQGHHFPNERSCSESLPSNSPWPSATSHSFDAPPQSHHTSPGRPQQSQHWAYEQSPGSSDFAPFLQDSAQRVRTPSTTYTATFPHSSPEQQWQLQQPSQSARSMTYPLSQPGMAMSLPQYASAYATSTPQQLPPASYPPFSVPLESPHIMTRQMQGPQSFFTPVSVGQGQPSFLEHASYDYRGGPHEHLHGAMPVQQGYPVSWYSEAGGLGVSVDEQHSVPSNAPPPTYVVPSQRPR